MMQLFDFGVATLLVKDTSQRVDYEMTGKVGSLRYMAPEVMLKDKKYNEKVDNYSK